DEVLVLNMQHLAWQYGVPVVHERQIAAVVTPKVVEVVAEGLSLGEVLLEGAETAIHGMAACVDDGRGRQDRVNEPHVAEVVGQFIGEVLAPPAERRGLVEVAD